jgi:hypothetical protein
MDVKLPPAWHQSVTTAMIAKDAYNLTKGHTLLHVKLPVIVDIRPDLTPVAQRGDVQLRQNGQYDVSNTCHVSKNSSKDLQ